ncbi:MAG: hypothetical protein WC223_06335 [Bacteroidales bacterium]|jgi:hypothetical protein
MKNISHLYNLPKHKPNNEHPQLLRVITSEKHTRIDFGYQCDSYYVRGGWVTIAPKTFICVKGSDNKLFLIKAENIPYAPEKYHFKSTVDNLLFSLYFPTLPAGINSFDIIEKENPKPTDFNYYDIQLNPTSAIPLLISE